MPLTLARSLVADMVHRESRCPGDRDNAMRRLAERHNDVSHSLLWRVLYRADELTERAIKRLLPRLLPAYEAECERQIRLIEEARYAAREAARKAGAAEPALCSVDRVVGDAKAARGRS